MKPEMLINARNLIKAYGKVQAVKNLSLQINAGETYGLVGPDGAGKTTTIRLICGALRLDSGQIKIAGHDINTRTEEARAQVGYLPQRFSLYEELTVMENIRFFAEMRGLSASEWEPRCKHILDFVGLLEFANRRAGYLSGGMKQKLGLATSLAHRPRVLLLDEPTTGVDPVTRQDFWKLIIRLVAEGNVATLVSTPYMDEAARCTRVGFMEEGELVAEGTPAELCSSLKGQVLELIGKPLGLIRRIAASHRYVEGSQLFGDRMHLRVEKGKATLVIRDLKRHMREAGGEIKTLKSIPPHLEDIFIALVEN